MPGRPGWGGELSLRFCNAANEVAVGAFLDGRISFADIAAVIDGVLDDVGTGPARDFRELFAVDEAARERSEELVGGLREG